MAWASYYMHLQHPLSSLVMIHSLVEEWMYFTVYTPLAWVQFPAVVEYFKWFSLADWSHTHTHTRTRTYTHARARTRMRAHKSLQAHWKDTRNYEATQLLLPSSPPLSPTTSMVMPLKKLSYFRRMLSSRTTLIKWRRGERPKLTDLLAVHLPSETGYGDRHGELSAHTALTANIALTHCVKEDSIFVWI